MKTLLFSCTVKPPIGICSFYYIVGINERSINKIILYFVKKTNSL